MPEKRTTRASAAAACSSRPKRARTTRQGQDSDMGEEASIAQGQAAKGLIDVPERFMCAVCFDVMLSPMCLQHCSHAFCESCIREWSERSPTRPACPICRANYRSADVTPASELRREMASMRVSCSCGAEVSLSSARTHSRDCADCTAAMEHTSPSAQAAGAGTEAGDGAGAGAEGRRPPPMVNRVSFTCPVCEERNLDAAAMVEHMEAEHVTHSIPAVCPICAAHPWGNASYRSPNIAGHVTQRHRFTYDTFADFAEDEDEALRRVLAASVDDC
mmetsp:Transcript_15237/g.50034  ORF Transcript_15237/g.50034 Transcript_15237/m.50034 type:complete len:275 (+) Transcript_15237:567-1391(+)